MMSRSRKNKSRRDAPGASRRGGSKARSGPTPAKLSRGKKLLFAGVATVLVLALLEGALAILGVRPVLYETDPYVGFSNRVPLFVPQEGAPGVMATAANKLAFFNKQYFARKKPPDTYRIFSVGGSTTYGRPHDDKTSFSGWLRKLLAAAEPDREWEVINAGGVSYASYRVALLMEELVRYEPDLFIIYSAHNEFLERRTYDSVIKMPAAIRGLGAIAGRTRVYTVVKRAIEAARRRKVSGGGDESTLSQEVWTRLDDAIGPQDYHRDDEFRRQVIEHYRYNLLRMIDIAKSAGAEVVLVTPASNVRHCSPFKSEHRAGLTEAQLARWQELAKSSDEHFAKSEWAQSLAPTDEALEIDDRHAHMQYRRGTLLWSLERFDEARAAFIRARDEDVCPLRALTGMAQIVRDVAAERGARVIDLERIVAKTAAHGAPGRGWFLDHVHPTVEGNGTLALLLLDEMTRAGIVKPTALWGDDKIRADKIRAVRDGVLAEIDDKKRAAALRNLSKVLSWAGKYEDALHPAMRAVELNPSDWEAYIQVGYCNMMLDRDDAAIEYCLKSIKIKPDPKAHSNIAVILTKRGRYREAIGHLHSAKALLNDEHSQRYRTILNESIEKLQKQLAAPDQADAGR